MDELTRLQEQLVPVEVLADAAILQCGELSSDLHSSFTTAAADYDRM